MSQTLLLGKPVPVRSLCFRNELGEWRRYRVCAMWDYSAVKFTRTPAQANLVKDENGRIGVKITGRDSGLVKVGAKRGVFDSLFAPFNALSKKPKNNLLGQTKLSLVEEDGMLIGRE